MFVCDASNTNRDCLTKSIEFIVGNSFCNSTRLFICIEKQFAQKYDDSINKKNSGGY